MLVTLRKHLVEQKRVIPIKAEHHFSSFFVRLALSIDIFDDFSCEGMQYELVHLRADKLSECLFLGVKWRIMVQLRGQIV